MGVRADRKSIPGAGAALTAALLALSVLGGEASSPTPPPASRLQPCLELRELFAGQRLPSDEELRQVPVETANKALELARECLEHPAPAEPPPARRAEPPPERTSQPGEEQQSQSAAEPPAQPAAEPAGEGPDESAPEPPKAPEGIDQKTAGGPVPTLAEARDFVARLKPLLGRVNRGVEQRNAFLQALDLLRPLSNKPRRREQLPPSDGLSDCDALWAAIDGLLALARGASDLSPEAAGQSIEEAIATAKQLDGHAETFCRYREGILEFGTARLERDYQYFTWTETWSTIEAVVHALRQSDPVQCR